MNWSEEVDETPHWKHSNFNNTFICNALNMRATETFQNEDSSMPYFLIVPEIISIVWTDWFDDQIKNKTKKKTVFVCRLCIVVSHWCYNWTSLSGPSKNLTDLSYLMATLSIKILMLKQYIHIFTHYSRHTKQIIFMFSVSFKTC